MLSSQFPLSWSKKDKKSIQKGREWYKETRALKNGERQRVTRTDEKTEEEKKSWKSDRKKERKKKSDCDVLISN